MENKKTANTDQVLEHMTNAGYHSSKSIGSTDIKAMLKSPAHFKAHMDGLLNKTSKAFDIGTAAHSAILEQDYSKYSDDIKIVEQALGEYGKPTKNIRATKVYKELIAEAQKSGQIILTAEEHGMIRGMFEQFFAHGKAARLVNDGKPEVSFFCKDPETGLMLKARTDYLVQTKKPDGSTWNFIVDYKTTSDAGERAFMNSVVKFGYHISAAHYKAVVEQCMGIKIDHFFWIAQEKSVPYGVRIYQASADMLETGERTRRNLLDKIQESYLSDEYPCYPEEIRTLELPSWADGGE